MPLIKKTRVIISTIDTASVNLHEMIGDAIDLVRVNPQIRIPSIIALTMTNLHSKMAGVIGLCYKKSINAAIL